MMNSTAVLIFLKKLSVGRICIIIAAVIDFLDGFVARFLKQHRNGKTTGFIK